MKKEYMVLVKCEHSPYDKFKVWHRPLTRSSNMRGIYSSKEIAMAVVKEALDTWDGKPKNTKRERMSAKMAKEMMVTDWRIREREVSDWETTDIAHIEYDKSFAKDDPNEDWIAI